jgi:hypothetical protein
MVIGNKRRCAEALGASVTTLYNRLSGYNRCGDVVRLCVV